MVRRREALKPGIIPPVSHSDEPAPIARKAAPEGSGRNPRLRRLAAWFLLAGSILLWAGIIWLVATLLW